MSVATETAAKVHAGQIAAASRAEEVVSSLLEKVAGAVHGATAKIEVPESVSGPVEKVTAPVAKVLGTPAEAKQYAGQSVRDWIGLQQKFQNDVLAAFSVGASKTQA